METKLRIPNPQQLRMAAAERAARDEKIVEKEAQPILAHVGEMFEHMANPWSGVDITKKPGVWIRLRQEARTCSLTSFFSMRPSVHREAISLAQTRIDALAKTKGYAGSTLNVETTVGDGEAHVESIEVQLWLGKGE